MAMQRTFRVIICVICVSIELEVLRTDKGMGEALSSLILLTPFPFPPFPPLPASAQCSPFRSTTSTLD